MKYNKNIPIKDQKILLKIKGLLNHLDYIIKPEHKDIVDLYHQFCRKYCSFGIKNEK